ncbi:MAG TPA: hypothetical protein GX521_04510, partial [Firmicutes bacterium]|nr:hypothetical protein [Bacillota bacterium]
MSAIRSFLRLKEFLKEHKRYYIIGILALLVTNSAQLVIPKLMGRFTDLIATGEFTRRDLIIFIGAMIGLSIVVAAFRCEVPIIWI